jgi:hypothetical protein
MFQEIMVRLSGGLFIFSLAQKQKSNKKRKKGYTGTVSAFLTKIEPLL